MTAAQPGRSTEGKATYSEALLIERSDHGGKGRGGEGGGIFLHLTAKLIRCNFSAWYIRATDQAPQHGRQDARDRHGVKRSACTMRRRQRSRCRLQM